MEIGTRLPRNIGTLITARLLGLLDYLRKRKEQSGGLRKLFDRIYNFEHLSDSLFQSDQLCKDWIFLKISVGTIFSSDAAAEFESIAQKIDGVANDIGRELSFCDDELGKYRLHEILTVLGGCQRRTNEVLKSEEIGEALEDVSKFATHSLDTGFWESIIIYLGILRQPFRDAGNVVLNEKVDILFTEMEMIQAHLYLGKMHDLRARLSSVAWRVAVECCNFRFNRRDPQVVAAAFVDLHKEMVPSNPQFLQFILRFLESSDVDSFCRYLISRRCADDLGKELESLVSLFINNKLEDGAEDVQSFFAEILAVLGEAAFTYCKADDLSMPPNPMLLTKLCLLKAERQSFFSKCISKLALPQGPSFSVWIPFSKA